MFHIITKERHLLCLSQFLSVWTAFSYPQIIIYWMIVTSKGSLYIKNINPFLSWFKRHDETARKIKNQKLFKPGLQLIRIEKSVSKWWARLVFRMEWMAVGFSDSGHGLWRLVFNWKTVKGVFSKIYFFFFFLTCSNQLSWSIAHIPLG